MQYASNQEMLTLYLLNIEKSASVQAYKEVYNISIKNSKNHIKEHFEEKLLVINLHTWLLWNDMAKTCIEFILIMIWQETATQEWVSIVEIARLYFYFNLDSTICKLDPIGSFWIHTKLCFVLFWGSNGKKKIMQIVVLNTYFIYIGQCNAISKSYMPKRLYFLWDF